MELATDTGIPGWIAASVFIPCARVKGVEMEELSDKDIVQYFRRSYTAVDGLWFMKVEDRRGFDEALEVDSEVWKVLPKIQVRTLKAMTRLEQGLHALFRCFTTKLTLEEYVFTTAWEGENVFKVMISRCPWYDMMLRSGREELAGKIGAKICKTEYAVWANEFDRESTLEMNSFLCHGADYCQVEFRRRENVSRLPGEPGGDHEQPQQE